VIAHVARLSELQRAAQSGAEAYLYVSPNIVAGMKSEWLAKPYRDRLYRKRVDRKHRLRASAVLRAHVLKNP